MSSNENFDTDIVDISEFFSGGDSFSETESEEKSTFNDVDSPIKELKAIILSLDWEITSEIADSFIEEVDRLSEVWKSDKTVVSFLHILRALGKYLRTHKADAHPSSIKLLYSVYNNFEKIVLTNEISEEQEQQILKEELEKFHDLKEKIALAATAASEGKANESLLSALKTILLEIDWQVTDQTMQKFDIEIVKLERIWSTDKNFLTLLQMMRAIGSYINKNKRDSLPDSIKLLSTVFQHFEQMALTEEMPPEEQQILINSDLEKFSHLKEQIAATKVQPTPDSIIESITQEAPETHSPKDLPAHIHEGKSELSEDDDFGHVEPISFDSDDTLLPAAGMAEISEMEGGTKDEVASRLNDLFSPADKNLEEGDQLTFQETQAEEDSEVNNRLDNLFAENDQGIAFNSDSIDNSRGMGEVTPLPDNDTVDLSFSKDEDGSSALTDSVVIDLQTDDAEMLLPGEMSGDHSQSPEVDLVTPLPEKRDGEFSQPDETTVLQEIITSAETINHLDTDSLTDAIHTLQSKLYDPGQQIVLKIMQSLTLYAKKMENNFHPDCLKLLNVSSQILTKIENHTPGKDRDTLQSIQSAVEQYIEFQNSIIFPTVADFLAKEKEIKKILGITS